MAEYLIFFNDEWVTTASNEQWQARARNSRAVIEEMKAAGVYLFGGGLDNDAPAIHVVPDGGQSTFRDGPYVETRERFGGFTAIDVPDEASARYWASRTAEACEWPFEVRIFRTPDQIPAPDAD